MKHDRKPGAGPAKRHKKAVCQQRKPSNKGVMYCVFDKHHGGGHSWEVKR